MFGPLAPDNFFQFHEVGLVDTLDGPTYLLWGFVAGDRGDGQFVEIDGVRVRLTTSTFPVEASWPLEPSEMFVSTRSLDQVQLMELLPELVAAGGTADVARILADRIGGATVRYAGPAPRYDVGLAYEDGSLSIAGSGVDAAQVDAYYAIFGGEQADADDEWRTDTLGATDGRARDATVILGSDRERAEVDGPTFAEEVDDEIAGADATVAVSDGFMTSVGHGCDGQPQPDRQTDATISDVAVTDSVVGYRLRITFEGLPADRADIRLVHVAIGDVELVAEYEGDDTVLFPAVLTQEEAMLLAARLSR